MALLSCLGDCADLVVLDTSVVINLNATGCAEEIVRALPNRLSVTDAVLAELDQGRQRSRQDAELFGRLVDAGLVQIATLGEPAMVAFEQLVIGPAAATLDDGEASTIAFAVEQKATALIDERKANSLCSARFPELRIGCTIDLLVHPAVERHLAGDRLAQVIVNALRGGRMRVPLHHLEGIVGLIGAERAALCHSLPRHGRLLGSETVIRGCPSANNEGG